MFQVKGISSCLSHFNNLIYLAHKQVENRQKEYSITYYCLFQVRRWNASPCLQCPPPSRPLWRAPLWESSTPAWPCCSASTATSCWSQSRLDTVSPHLSVLCRAHHSITACRDELVPGVIPPLSTGHQTVLS